jgi:serine phosphatase RsbU (regulator of sigma subunit)
VANAGHIPPLLVRDRRATYQESTGTLLGVHPRQHRSHTLALRSGDRVVLMTDGLVERRSQAIGPALDRLAEQVAVSTTDGELLCDELMQAWGDGEDDVCLVIVDILGEDAPFAATRPGYLA